MIGTWFGFASDQRFTVCRQRTNVVQVVPKSRSLMCNTLKPGWYISEWLRGLSPLISPSLGSAKRPPAESA